MNIEDMLTLIEAVKKHGIESFSYKNETEKIVIKKKPKQTVLASELEVLKDVQAYDNEEKEDIVSDIGSDKVVASPLVGTFYAAPSP